MEQLEDRFSGLTSIRGHHLLASRMGPDSIVVDLGAHLGEFSAEVSRQFGSRCLAVEANPVLFGRIPSSPRLSKFHYAIASRSGPITFAINENPESSRVVAGSPSGSQTVEVAGITLPELLELDRTDRVDLLKVDIEGAEFDLFESLSDAFLKGVPQVTVEFHDFMPDLRCGPKVEAVKERMRRLGFVCIVFSASNHGDTLFLDPARLGMSFRRQLYLRYAARYTRGLERRAKRFLGSTGLG